MSLTIPQRWAWVSLLLLVNWKPSEWGCQRCGKVLALPAGATARTYRNLAAAAGVGEHIMAALLRKSLRAGRASVTDRSRCHVAYVIENWTKYQGAVAEALQSGGRDVAEALQEEEGKKERRKEGTPDKSGEAWKIAGWWGETHPYWQAHLKEAVQQRAKWAEVIDKLNRLDGHSWEEIRALLKWAAEDIREGGGFPGWSSNCRSTAKLRKKNDDGVPYWDVISEAMARGLGRPRQQGIDYGPQDPARGW